MSVLATANFERTIVRFKALFSDGGDQLDVVVPLQSLIQLIGIVGLVARGFIAVPSNRLLQSGISCGPTTILASSSNIPRMVHLRESWGLEGTGGGY